MIKSAGQKNKKRAALIAFKLAVLFAALLIFSSPNQIMAQTSGAVNTAGQILGATPLGLGIKLGTAAVGSTITGSGNPVDAASATVGPSIIGTILSKVISWIAFVVNYIVSYIFGAAISVILYFITVIVSLNFGLAQSPLVQSGFPITLSIANLGFVLAIIVIAIMTIIRYETYALKSTLWKLVAAAILVNFSLVIASAILGFADGLTLAFLAGMNPAGGTGGVLGNLNAFALNMANSFGPQSVFLSAQISTASSTVAAQVEAAQGAGSSFASILVSISNLFFPTIFLILSAIALGGIFIMFLVRYVYLGILLILMPFAWLFWIFPVTSGQWHKWWDKFIQWTIFAPVVMFFLYLAMATTNGLKNAIVGRGDTEIVRSLAAIGFFPQSFAPMLQMATMVALVFAGLFTAQKMGIMFADSTLKGMTAVTSGFGGFVKRRAQMVGGAAMRTAKVDKAAEALQRFQPKGTGILAATGRLATYPVRMIGRGVEKTMVATGEDLVKDAKKRISDETTDQLAHGMTTFTAPERIAALDILRERGSLDVVGDRLGDYVNEQTFENYKQQPTYKNLNSAWASNEAMRSAARGGDAATLGRASMEYIITLKKSDVSKGKNWDDVFNAKSYGGMTYEQKRMMNIAQIRAMAERNKDLINPIVSQLKGGTLEYFQGMFDEAIRGLSNESELRGDLKQMIHFNLFAGAAAPSAPAASVTPPPPPAGGGTKT